MAGNEQLFFLGLIRLKGRFLIRYPTALVGGVCTWAETEAKAAKLL